MNLLGGGGGEFSFSHLSPLQSSLQLQTPVSESQEAVPEGSHEQAEKETDFSKESWLRNGKD